MSFLLLSPLVSLAKHRIASVLPEFARRRDKKLADMLCERETFTGSTGISVQYAYRGFHSESRRRELKEGFISFRENILNEKKTPFTVQGECTSEIIEYMKKVLDIYSPEEKISEEEVITLINWLLEKEPDTLVSFFSEIENQRKKPERRRKPKEVIIRNAVTNLVSEIHLELMHCERSKTVLNRDDSKLEMVTLSDKEVEIEELIHKLLSKDEDEEVSKPEPESNTQKAERLTADVLVKINMGNIIGAQCDVYAAKLLDKTLDQYPLLIGKIGLRRDPKRGDKENESTTLDYSKTGPIPIGATTLWIAKGEDLINLCNARADNTNTNSFYLLSADAPERRIELANDVPCKIRQLKTINYTRLGFETPKGENGKIYIKGNNITLDLKGSLYSDLHTERLIAGHKQLSGTKRKYPTDPLSKEILKIRKKFEEHYDRVAKAHDEFVHRPYSGNELKVFFERLTSGENPILTHIEFDLNSDQRLKEDLLQCSTSKEEKQNLFVKLIMAHSVRIFHGRHETSKSTITAKDFIKILESVDLEDIGVFPIIQHLIRQNLEFTTHEYMDLSTNKNDLTLTKMDFSAAGALIQLDNVEEEIIERVIKRLDEEKIPHSNSRFEIVKGQKEDFTVADEEEGKLVRLKPEAAYTLLRGLDITPCWQGMKQLFRYSKLYIELSFKELA